MTKYIFITGGVVSSLGKGVTSASLGAILKAQGRLVTLMKLDPYINVDPGTMSPEQHGEVFVTEDGAETDLDLGHYERFVQITMRRANSVSAGLIYRNVIQRERTGEYLGATVQVIPHITDEIKRKIYEATQGTEVALIEIGGTVGDIESLPFLEAIRQMRIEQGAKNTVFIHLTLVPYITSAQEIKTKPTQHSVKELRSIGIQTDILVCRSQQPLSVEAKEKIALFTNVAREDIISLFDVESLYEVPSILEKQNISERIDYKTHSTIDKRESDLSDWARVVQAHKYPRHTVEIIFVGKYKYFSDAYKSLNEALAHAGIQTNTRVNLTYIEPESLEKDIPPAQFFEKADGILVPGGFGVRGFPGKLAAIYHARTQNVPFLGICLGMQIACIEFARNQLGLHTAQSTEFDAEAETPVIDLVYADAALVSEEPKFGGKMRLGAKECRIKSGSLAHRVYNSTLISERHRHRYGLKKEFVESLQVGGLHISAYAVEDPHVPEIIELPNHRWFMACQYHPEFSSTPRAGHPLFTAFIQAALLYSQSK